MCYGFCVLNFFVLFLFGGFLGGGGLVLVYETLLESLMAVVYYEGWDRFVQHINSDVGYGVGMMVGVEICL